MMSIYLCGVLCASGHTRGNSCLRYFDWTFREAVQEAGGEVREKGEKEYMKKEFFYILQNAKYMNSGVSGGERTNIIVPKNAI